MNGRFTTGLERRPPRPWLRVLLMCVALLPCLSCSGNDDLPFVRLSSEETPEYAEGEGSRAPLRVAVAPMTSAQVTAVTYQPFIKYLSNKLKRPAVLVQRRTYAEINELVRVGRVDLAFVCSGAYVEGHRRFGMELLAAPVAAGKLTYRSYIITSSETGATSFAELKGKRFAFTDVLSNTGFIYPTYLLRTMDQDAASFFSQVIFTNSHDRSIRAVADQVVDAAAVDSLVYDQLVATDRTLAAATRIIAQSPVFGMPPVVVHPVLRRPLREKLLALLLGMRDDPAASTALASLGISRFASTSDAAYNSVREIADGAQLGNTNG